jgi:hypothetical protein
MLEGEDAVHNRELFDQLRAAVRPADCIYEMLIADVAYSQRHLDRLRRWNECLLQTCAHKALQNFLAQNLDDDLYADCFVNDLAEALKEGGVSEDRALAVAQACAREQADCVEVANDILAQLGPDMDDLRDAAREKRAEELVQAYARRETRAVKVIRELLARDGVSMDTLMADAYADELPRIGPIDCLAASVESRRNNALREIDRHRAARGDRFRLNGPEAEEAEFEEVDQTTAKGNKVA